jgi:hypothetical protein
MLRFTIRDVLWLTVVVALGVAWWIDRTRLMNRPQPAREESYEVIVGDQDRDKVYLFNPRTGHMWHRHGGSGEWTDYAKFPTNPAK